MTVTVELYGLEVAGAHGVEEEERRRPQPFLYDLWLEVPDAATSDRLEATVDYRDVVSGKNDTNRGAFYYVDAFLGKRVTAASYSLKVSVARR